MSDLRDLPLFSWRQVLPFPLARQIRKVRDTAEELATKDSDEAEAYAKIVTVGIRRRMTGQGFADSATEHEIRTFWCAVDQEMARIVYGRRPSSDGAA